MNDLFKWIVRIIALAVIGFISVTAAMSLRNWFHESRKESDERFVQRAWRREHK